jgi:hypothetical protein
LSVTIFNVPLSDRAARDLQRIIAGTDIDPFPVQITLEIAAEATGTESFGSFATYAEAIRFDALRINASMI